MDQLQAELNLPILKQRARDRSEREGINEPVGLIHRGMIERIKEFRSKLNRKRLTSEILS